MVVEGCDGLRGGDVGGKGEGGDGESSHFWGEGWWLLGGRRGSVGGGEEREREIQRGFEMG